MGLAADELYETQTQRKVQSHNVMIMISHTESVMIIIMTPYTIQIDADIGYTILYPR